MLLSTNNKLDTILSGKYKTVVDSITIVLSTVALAPITSTFSITLLSIKWKLLSLKLLGAIPVSSLILNIYCSFAELIIKPYSRSR